MTIAETSTPKRLRRLKIDKFSFVDAPASVGSDVLVWKRDGGGATSDGLRERIAKIEADITAMRANTRVDELFAAMAKGDTARGCELLKDKDTHLAYRARLAGERWQAPVEVAKAEPDHRAEIRNLLAAGDADGLTRLFRAAPAAHGQYRGMLGSEELAAAGGACRPGVVCREVGEG
jgi:hypothetical protein